MIPEAVDTLPYFLKYGGIIQTSIKFTPCIEPINKAANAIVPIKLLPASNKRPNADNKPIENTKLEQDMGFLNFFLI